jgi:hypothetical protein
MRAGPPPSRVPWSWDSGRHASADIPDSEHEPVRPLEVWSCSSCIRCARGGRWLPHFRSLCFPRAPATRTSRSPSVFTTPIAPRPSSVSQARARCSARRPPTARPVIPAIRASASRLATVRAEAGEPACTTPTAILPCSVSVAPARRNASRISIVRRVMAASTASAKSKAARAAPAA